MAIKNQQPENEQVQESAVYNLLHWITGGAYGPPDPPRRTEGKCVQWWDKLEEKVKELYAENKRLKEVNKLAPKTEARKAKSETSPTGDIETNTTEVNIVNSNGSKAAFPPHTGQDDLQGLTHREWLVGMAMNGLLSGKSSLKEIDVEWITATAHILADRTLAATPEGAK